VDVVLPRQSFKQKLTLKLEIMTTIRNSVQLIGRLGKDPEIKTIGNDRKMARISLATSNNYYNAKGERVEETDWHNVVAFGKVVDTIEKYVRKGQEIAIEGKLTASNWEDKDGNKRYSVDIVLNELVLLQKVS
jgi:single-strand DNA-binding protein